MKRYEVYKNIRKRAVIWGLPISLFALFMLSIIASLLVVIFSFSMLAIFGVFSWNIKLYIVLIKITKHTTLFNFGSVFPRIISTKKDTLLNYESIKN